jgi:hypothetical protein
MSRNSSNGEQRIFNLHAENIQTQNKMFTRLSMARANIYLYLPVEWCSHVQELKIFFTGLQVGHQNSSGFHTPSVRQVTNSVFGSLIGYKPLSL